MTANSESCGKLRVGVIRINGIGNTHSTFHKQDALVQLVAVCGGVLHK